MNKLLEKKLGHIELLPVGDSFKGELMKKILAVLLCLGLAGCATVPQYNISIDSITNSEPTLGKTCAVTSGMKDVSTNDLQFIEFANYVKRALTLKGYAVSDDEKTADIDVFLGYGIGEPKEHNYSYAMPIFGQTGVSSATTSFVGNMATTTYNPSYGVVGEAPISGTFVTFTRQISLVAYDLKAYRETKKEKELWKTEIVSTGSSGDLRRVFPVLMAGATKYIGENTGEKVEVSLVEDSKEVLAIKGIAPEKNDSTGGQAGATQTK